MINLPLKKPIKLGEKLELTSLNFRDYTIAADYLSFDKRGGVAQRIALIASLTGSDESVIMQLRGVDYRAAEAIADKLLTEDEDGAAESDLTGAAEPQKSQEQVEAEKK